MAGDKVIADLLAEFVFGKIIRCTDDESKEKDEEKSRELNPIVYLYI